MSNITANILKKEIPELKEEMPELKEETASFLPLEPDDVSVEEEPIPPFIVEVNTLLDKLEQEGMQKVQKAWETEISPLTLNASNIFLKIMQDGANEFKEQTGRNMTYSEMRRLYG